MMIEGSVERFYFEEFKPEKFFPDLFQNFLYQKWRNSEKKLFHNLEEKNRKIRRIRKERQDLNNS